jgi:hypothetical protein
MKFPVMNQDVKKAEPDLFTRSYSPALRGLVVSVIFIVAVFLLAACGSKAKTASSPTATPTPTTAVTASASASTTGALTCNSGKYFGNILAQVKKEWKPDAVISSVRFERQYVKTFQDLCTLKTDSNWQMIFYSLSTKNEISGVLDNSKKDSSGVPPLTFVVDKTDNSASTSLTFADMTKQGGWKFHEYSRPEVYSYESKYAANYFLGWKMSMSDVVQKLIDRVRTEKITGTGFYISIGKASLKMKTPYVSMSWQNGTKNTSHYVEPISFKTYDVKS